MKRMGFLFALILIMVLTLSACGCRHAWKEADCLTPKTCAKCGETEGKASGHSWKAADCETPKSCTVCGEKSGEATGHTWQEATCMAPQTCQLCGVSQGETLPHSYGKWSISGEEMQRSCSACFQEEKTAIDREVYFRSNSMGHWDTDAIYTEGTWYNPYALGSQVGIYLYMDGETILFFNGRRQYEGSYTFREYENVDGTDTYRFVGEFEEGNELLLTYCEDSEKAKLLVGSTDQMYILAQNSMYTEAMAGCWGSITDNRVVYIQLNEDRSFEGDIQGPISGTWHVRPVHEKDGVRYMEIVLSSPNSGYQNNFVFKRYFYGEETELSQMLKREENTSISSYYGLYNSNYIKLQAMDKADLEQQTAQMEKSLKNIVGTWVSRERTIMSKQKDYSNNAAMVGYEFTFLEDGTFRSVMEEEKTGIWEYLDKPNDYARYFLYFDENPNDKSWSIELYDDGRMYIAYYGETENVHYKFEQKKERVYHETEGKLTGIWYPTVYTVYDPQTQKETSTTRKDDFITLNDDGTLIANLKGQCTGIWEYESSMTVDENSDNPRKIDTYALIINGKEEPYYVNYYANDGVFNLNYYDYEEERSYSCIFTKDSTEETMDFIDSGMEQILGEWVSTEYMETSLTSGNDVNHENTDKYSVSIHADGTFDYNYHQQGSGTWRYDGYDTSSNQLTYTFYYYEPGPFSYRYCIDKEDILFGWFETETSRIGYYFERKK